MICFISELAEHYTAWTCKDGLSWYQVCFSLTWYFILSTNGIRIINTDDSDIEMVYHHFLNIQPTPFNFRICLLNEGCDAGSISAKSTSVHPRFTVSYHINKIIKKQYRFEIASNYWNEIDIRYFLLSVFQRNIISLNAISLFLVTFR